MAQEPVARVASAAHDIGSFIRAQREAAQVSLRQLAQLAGVSNPYLSQIERGLRNPSAEVLSQIAKGLRMSSEVLYVRAGFLEQRTHSPVRDALLADAGLSERQKQVLLDIYDSFRRENGENGNDPDAYGDVMATVEDVSGGIRDNEVPDRAAGLATEGTAEVPPRQESETS